MLFSPMSEMPAVGRSRIYFWTLLGFVALQLPTGFALNMPMLLIFRFLTGFLSGPVLATGGATISDMYTPEKVTYGICIWGAFGILGPVLEAARRWLRGAGEGVALGHLGAHVAVCDRCCCSSSSSCRRRTQKHILYRRAQRLRKQTGETRLKCQSEVDTAESKARDHLAVLARAFTLIFSEPIILVIDLYTALLYGVLYVWFESFPLVFGGIYQFSIGQQGLVFLSIFVGALVTVPCYMLWLRWYLVPKPPRAELQA